MLRITKEQVLNILKEKQKNSVNYDQTVRSIVSDLIKAIEDGDDKK